MSKRRLLTKPPEPRDAEEKPVPTAIRIRGPNIKDVRIIGGTYIGFPKGIDAKDVEGLVVKNVNFKLQAKTKEKPRKVA